MWIYPSPTYTKLELKIFEQDMVVYVAFSPNTQEAEASQSVSSVSLVYIRSSTLARAA